MLQLISTLQAWIASRTESERGATMVEYGLLVALVAILMIGVVSVFGSNIKSWFGARTATITTV